MNAVARHPYHHPLLLPATAVPLGFPQGSIWDTARGGKQPDENSEWQPEQTKPRGQPFAYIKGKQQQRRQQRQTGKPKNESFFEQVNNIHPGWLPQHELTKP